VNNEDALGEAIHRKKRNADDLSEDFGDLSARTRRGITKKRESGDFGDFSVRKKRGIAKKRKPAVLKTLLPASLWHVLLISVT